MILGVEMQKTINYKGIFIAGCALMVSGVVLLVTIPFLGISILGCGLGLMAVGLAKRDEWDKKE